MNDLLKAVGLLAVLAVVAKGVGLARGTDDSQNPEVIKNPVYLEVRLTMENSRRSLEAVAIVETVDDADCQKISKDAMKALGVETEKEREPRLELKSVECKAELSLRNAQLFDNEPNVVSYVRAERGNRLEREMRWIFWGVSVEESDAICRMVPKLQRGLKGKVSCIRALRS